MGNCIPTQRQAAEDDGDHAETSSPENISVFIQTPAQEAPVPRPGQPSFLSQLIQTMQLFVLYCLIGYGMAKVLGCRAVSPVKILERAIEQLETIRAMVKDAISSIITSVKDIDFTWMLRKPSKWWATDQVNWDSKLKLEFMIAAITVMMFLLDLLFSSETKQGHWILLVPTFLYSLVYFAISFHAQTAGLLVPEVYASFNVTKIATQVFNQDEIVFMVTSHLFALDLALSYAMMKDFYSRVSSRRMGYRLLMIPITIWPPAQGISIIPIYLMLRATLFASPKARVAKKVPSNRNNYKRELDYLMDPVPEPKSGGALNSWVRRIPSPLDIPFFVFFVGLGTIRFVLMLMVYFFYVFGFCLPFSALFFSIRRSWKLLRGQRVQGAVYGPFDMVTGKFPKAVLVVTCHLRLICFKNKKNALFNWTIGWWLRAFLEAFIMYEFTIPFKTDFSPYVAFLMEEFGAVFPMGQGLGFGAYKDVKAIIENPDQRKSGLSLAWSISTAQFDWSKNTLTSLPQTENEKAIVAEGREIVRCWLKDVSKNLKDPLTQKRLDAILPYRNVDGSMVDKTLVEISFGSVLFHLLTEGEFTAHESRRYHKLLTNAFPFMSDWINKVWFGGILEYSGMQDYDLMRRALLRYADASSLQDSLALAEESCWDAWSPSEVVRFLVFQFVVAGAAAPAFLLSAIVQKLYDKPELVSVYHSNKRKFILEVARLERCVPLVNFMAHKFELGGRNSVTIFDELIQVPDGTPLHCSIQNANRDVSVFGANANELNFDRNPSVQYQMMTFNGNEKEIMNATKNGQYDSPPRRCPGWSYVLDIIEFLVTRYCPLASSESPPMITLERLSEIQSKETIFMKFVLKLGQFTYAENNKYFPHASDVKHPLDTEGRELGYREINASGTRSIPLYDEDVTVVDMKKDELTALVLSTFPLTDDEGEWQNPEEAMAWRMKWFDSNFPPVNIDYTVYKTVDNMVSHLAFAGMCSLHTRKVDGLPKDSLICKSLPNGAVYVNDVTGLGTYRVRRGYQRYGAAAYFDAEFNLVGVYTCHDGQLHLRPDGIAAAIVQGGRCDFFLENESSSDWRHAMWAWRVSALALVTVADHLVNVHMINANSLVSASRRHLPINHSLRAFLKIFTFRTIGINNKARLTLLMKKGIVNRNWAFEDDDLQKLLHDTECTFKKNFMDYIPESMRNVQEYPMNHDMTKYWKVTREMVHDILCIVYDAPGTDGHHPRLRRNLNNDESLQAFLEELSSGLGLLQRRDLREFDDIVDVLSSLICSVTGMHEHVGQISDFFAHPKIAGSTIRRGKEIDSIQIYQLNTTLVSSTGLRMPRLLGNWDHLLVRNRFADETVQVMQRYQGSLRALSLEIDALNKPGVRRFQLESFNPVYLESSVSV